MIPWSNARPSELRKSERPTEPANRASPVNTAFPMQDLELERAGLERFAFLEAHHVADPWGRDRKFIAQRLALEDHLALSVMHRHGDRTQFLQKVSQPGDMVYVRVSQEDRLHRRAALPNQPRHQLGLEVGVDHDCVPRAPVLHQVRVGAEPAVGGGLNPDGHANDFRTITCLSVSRYRAKPARSYISSGPR